MKVKVYGAGSIGNHLTHGCRNKDWEVLMCDTDPDALARTKEDIYPSRYGEWDDEVRLCEVSNLPNEYFDLIIIGTPPDTHMNIALTELSSEHTPKVILIEKPACSPSLEGMQEVAELAAKKGVIVTVGYNHVLTDNTKRLEELVYQGVLGNVITLSAATREHWGGIFSAHPWLAGPHDTYLGFYAKGGGACGEHSHAINIWLHIAHLCEMGRITEVTATMDMVEDSGSNYDSIALLNVKTEKGFIGSIIQDVVTEPPLKTARIQGDKGFIEWEVNRTGSTDGITYRDENGEVINESFSKTRPQDFAGEIDHVGDLLAGNVDALESSPIAMQRGFDTMMVVAAAYLSGEQGRTVSIDYSKGYTRVAFTVI